MGETNADIRSDISYAVGLTSPRGAFRKDDLNVILDHLGGEAKPAHAVYGHDAPAKEWFYVRVAQAAGFDYDRGDGENARPFNRDELLALREAVENQVDSATAI